MASPDYDYTDDQLNDKVTEGRSADAPYDLGSPAKDIYHTLDKTGRRQQVLELARQMSELTITSAMPPQSWHTGDELPGNNQSVGAQCVSTLASKLMFAAFPPGQPIMRLDPNEQKLQKEILADPLLYANIELALSRLEVAHRKKAATIGLATAWVGYQELLLIAGNCLWKHITLENPTFHKMDTYVVSRDGAGHPIVTIHHERVRLATLSKDIQEQLMQEDTEDKYKDQPEWERVADIYSVCRLCREGDGGSPYVDWCWEYWQETEKGTVIEGTEIETDYDDCPMWPGWLRPSFGDDWGLPYCEKYRGDLYIVEAGNSALNDGASLAAWALTLVKPGSRTNIKTVRTSKNLSVIPGSAEDLTVFRSDKSADFGFVTTNTERAERRLGVAFLLQSAARRDGERVTAEEVQRVGQELDQAMGGLYTQSAQGNQRRMIMRLIHLNTEATKLPSLPPGLVDVQVVTGVDAMGRSTELQALLDFADAMAKTFPQKVDQIINASDFANRLASAMTIKPDGLVNTPAQIAANLQTAQQQTMQHTLVNKAAGPVSGELAKGAAAHMLPPPPPQQQQQQDQGAPPDGQGT